MKQTLAIFDFDSTITLKDSFSDFLFKTCKKNDLLFAFIKNLPILIGYKLKIVSNESAKESVFRSLFRNMEESAFIKICARYSFEKIPKIVNPKALNKIDWHKKQGHELIIISASLEDYIWPWALQNGFTRIICTKVEKINRKLTGRLGSKNCYGPEKVDRFKQEYPKRENYFIYSYTDSRSDKDILQMADKPFYRKF